MTVTTTDNRVVQDADGVQTRFYYTFLVYTADSLKVYFGDTLQVSGYTVTLDPGFVGGYVDFTVAPPDAIGTVTLARIEDLDQETDLVPYDKFPSKVIEQSFDKLTMICQQLADTIGRSITAPINDPVGTELTIPPFALRLGKVLAFDPVTGDPIASDFTLEELENAQTTAQDAANTATTQAGIATAQAVIATTQAGIATTQAGIATTQATLAAASAASIPALAARVADLEYGFVSTQQTFAGNSTITVPHGLGVVPTGRVILELQCIIASIGYLVGDKIQLGEMQAVFNPTPVYYGFNIVADATNINVYFASGSILIVDKVTGRSLISPNSTNFRIVVKVSKK